MYSVEDFVKDKLNDCFISSIGFGTDLKIVLPKGIVIYTKGSLQSDDLSGRDLRKLQDHTHKLFVDYPLVYEEGEVYKSVFLSPGMKITVNDCSYEIVSIVDELKIAEINLTRKV